MRPINYVTNQINFDPSAEKTPNRPENPRILVNPTFR